MSNGILSVSELLEKNMDEVYELWTSQLKKNGGDGGGRIREAELQTQCKAFLAALKSAIATGSSDVDNEAYGPVRDLLS